MSQEGACIYDIAIPHGENGIRMGKRHRRYGENKRTSTSFLFLNVLDVDKKSFWLGGKRGGRPSKVMPRFQRHGVLDLRREDAKGLLGWDFAR
jgi:hypothetical protein